ncbi:MAG: gamma-glutamyltransferase [Acidimicrobiia bacterium]
MQIAVASSSALAAEAGARLAAEGGNAVDAALASAIVAATTEPGVSSLVGGGFVTIWPPDDEPVTVDGYAEMPGREAPPESRGGGLRKADFPYGDGVSTLVGHGSVATPGSPAAIAEAHRLYGRAPWPELFRPAIEHALRGFPMPPASYRYLITSYDAIYGEAEQSVLGPDGDPAAPGTEISIPDLAEALEAFATEGVGLLYRGEMANRLVEDMKDHGGLIGESDLEAYEAIVRQPLRADIDSWNVATNPPPAVGGATLAAMLLLASPLSWPEWGSDEIAQMVQIQATVLDHRRRKLDVSTDLSRDAATLLEKASGGDPEALAAPSTSHTSAVDRDGLVCSVTVSMGYGAGVVIPGTGLWLNNHLGELELNRRGVHALEPGSRLASNMAPTAARRSDGSALAVGSPGAGRIATALLQVMVNLIKMGMGPKGAISAPRLHVDQDEHGPLVLHEPGLEIELPGMRARSFADLDMFFGGVALATKSSSGDLSAASDSRREGSVAYF